MLIDKPFDAMLTLALPVALEEDILDFLLMHPEWAAGFTVVDAQGMGNGATLRSAMEKVQGRSRGKLVFIAGVDPQLRALLAALSCAIPSREVTYWMSPVSAFGRLA